MKKKTTEKAFSIPFAESKFRKIEATYQRREEALEKNNMGTFIDILIIFFVGSWLLTSVAKGIGGKNRK